MIISDKYQCIFIRIPKTGSTTIEKLLIAADPDCLSSDNSTPPYGHHGWPAVKEMAGDRWDSYFKFAFVRNPYAWFLSNYADHMNYRLDDVWGVHEILNENHQLPEPWNFVIDAPRVLALASMMQFWYHGDYLGGKYNRIVTQSAWVPHGINFIGRMESFDEDLGIVAQAIGLELTQKAPKENQSKSSQLMLDHGGKRLVTELYDEDFERFGYGRRE
jgi:hypothetical protein